MVGLTQKAHGLNDNEVAQLAVLPWKELSPKLRKKFSHCQTLLENPPENPPQWAKAELAAQTAQPS